LFSVAAIVAIYVDVLAKRDIVTDKGSLQFVGLDFLQWWIQRVTTLTEIEAAADAL
jgi:hypothetical protein